MNRYAKILIFCCATITCAKAAYAQRYDTCAYLAAWEDVKPQNSVEAQQQYDSLKLYIKQCASRDNDSWRAFLHIDGAVQRLSLDSDRFDQYRGWLISVLYFNTTNPSYFCACMGAIMGTFQAGKYRGTGALAVEDYIRKNHRDCFGSDEDAQYTKDSLSLVNAGYDAAHLPPLDSLGLGFLLNNSSVPENKLELPSQYILSFGSTPNPFLKETALQFTLNRKIYTTVEVYDELGRLVWGDRKGSSLEAGTHTITLDGKNLPHGTLYARITTGFGEVKTVKLIHD